MKSIVPVKIHLDNLLPLNDYYIPKHRVVESIEQLWIFKYGIPFVNLKSWQPSCPTCKTSGTFVYRRWKFFPVENSRFPFRIDLSFKCNLCSCVWGVGIPVEINCVEEYPYLSKFTVSNILTRKNCVEYFQYLEKVYSVKQE